MALPTFYYPHDTLRDEYKNLRQVIPSLRIQRNVNKIEVVSEAARYIDHLHKSLIEKFTTAGIPANLKGLLRTDDPHSLNSNDIKNLVTRLASANSGNIRNVNVSGGGGGGGNVNGIIISSQNHQTILQQQRQQKQKQLQQQQRLKQRQQLLRQQNKRLAVIISGRNRRSSSSSSTSSSSSSTSSSSSISSISSSISSSPSISPIFMSHHGPQCIQGKFHNDNDNGNGNEIEVHNNNNNNKDKKLILTKNVKQISNQKFIITTSSSSTSNVRSTFGPTRADSNCNVTSVAPTIYRHHHHPYQRTQLNTIRHRTTSLHNNNNNNNDNYLNLNLNSNSHNDCFNDYKIVDKTVKQNDDEDGKH